MQHLIIWIGTGLVAGWIARIGVGQAYRIGFVGNLTIGCLGAIFGGWISRRFAVIDATNPLSHFLVATAGAVALLLIIRGSIVLISAAYGSTRLEETARGLDLDALVTRASEIERAMMVNIFGRLATRPDPNRSFDASLTVGERVADKVASFGGSWTFIGLFFIAMSSWMILNEEQPHAFDPYPFILLNLVLSCLAAIQAPIIMMSQNRQAARDRADAQSDYEVNLRAEMQIGLLHEKVEQLHRAQLATLTEEIRSLRTEVADLRARGAVARDAS